MTATAPQIRPATPQDAASIAALSIEVWIATYLRGGINDFFATYVLDTFTKARMAAVLSSPTDHLWVSQNAQGIDGFIRVTHNAPAPVAGCPDTEISTFYVQPRHHGKGIGTALLNRALDHCRGIGASGVWLATNAQNMPAIEYYLAKGFAHVGHTHFTVQDQGYLNNVYRYAFD